MSLTYFYDPFDEFDNFFDDNRVKPYRRYRNDQQEQVQRSNVLARPFAPK